MIQNGLGRLLRPFVRLSRLPSRFAAMERSVRRMETSHREHRREIQQALAQLMLPAESVWRRQPPLLDASVPGERVFEQSAMCRQDSFQQPYFSYWTRRLGERLRYHRKLWEFVFVSQALWERGVCARGRRGLGFGVGREPLAALFASEGVAVTATDLAPDGVVEAGWQATNQHAGGKEALRNSVVCPDDLFDRNVEFRFCDMNHVAADLVGYDFCWSACALEHLGSIEKGLAFIERSINCLVPGGWAVHTTEYNVSSDKETVDNLGTVLFRRRDLEALAQRLRAKGHEVATMDWSPGEGPVDRYLDMPPYRPDPHLKMMLSGFTTTSIGIIVRRGLGT
ncbi:hypothetical protein [Brevundimonas sp.]|uniref:hypothetical protein n=1 Tax=Brevundimonas sp. TaxID=1871086 RepID=UPI0025C2E2C8|nr:hypothetical protein [Brevundimonas sp.]